MSVTTWRTHSCVPCSHSCEHLLIGQAESVHMSVNAARTSACATCEWEH